jgi:hypothetical protein
MLARAVHLATPPALRVAGSIMRPINPRKQPATRSLRARAARGPISPQRLSPHTFNGNPADIVLGDELISAAAAAR